tara:strand:+ start:12006 stop:12902 length:897 start_codon:yes stop_codon:yes gene_type:complete
MNALSRLISILGPNKKNIGFVSHDSGGSNLLAYMAMKMDSEINKKVSAEGPGMKIWSDVFPSIEFCQADTVINFSDLIITGTGNTDFEHQIRVKAKENNKYTIAVIDHWVNYLERFSFNGSSLFPDEIWVTDEEALKLAKNLFTNVKIIHINNDYYNFVKFQIGHNNLKSKNILYVMEPIEEVWSSNTPGWLDAFSFFWENRDLIANGKIEKIIIRPHPKDQINKYDILMNMYENIYVDEHTSIINSLMNISSVVGVESAALDLSNFCGIQTFSSMPPWGRKIKIPVKKINLISDLTS